MAKEAPPKTKRNKRILKYHQDGLSYNAIGGIFHISKARVGQIIKRSYAQART